MFTVESMDVSYQPFQVDTTDVMLFTDAEQSVYPENGRESRSKTIPKDDFCKLNNQIIILLSLMTASNYAYLF